jgi:hypothetical protein
MLLDTPRRSVLPCFSHLRSSLVLIDLPASSLDADLFFSKLVQRLVKSLPLGDSSFNAVFRSQSTAPNAFVISSLELVLSLICSLPATGGVPKLLVYPLAAFFWSIPDSTKVVSEDHLSGFILVGAHLFAIISSLCCRWFVVCSSSGFGCRVSRQKLLFFVWHTWQVSRKTSGNLLTTSTSDL